MTPEYYVMHGEEQHGPLSMADLRLAIAKDELQQDDLVWWTGQETWQRAAEIPGLFSPPPVAGMIADDTTGLTDAGGSERNSNDDDSPTLIATPQQVVAPSSPAIERPIAKRNFIIRHWQGDLSLPVSYWLINFLATLAIISLAGVLQVIESNDALNPHLSGSIILAYWGIALLIVAWQVVGLWRSASKHPLRGGSVGWARVAKVMAVLAVLRVCADVYNIGLPMIEEGGRMLIGIDHVPSYALRILGDGKEMELSGGFSFGTTAAVRKTLDATPTIRTIHLNSVGGRLTEAVQLHQLISERKLVTYVATECDSACTLAFLGGSERYLADHARLGFHSGAIVGSTVMVDGFNDRMRDVYRAHGLPESFINKALSTPPDHLWYPTVEELKAAKVIDDVVDASRYGSSGIADWQDAHKIEDSLLTVPIFAALAKYDHDNYGKLRDVMVQGLQAGKPTQDIKAQVHLYFAKKVIPIYLRKGPDAELIRYWKSQIAEASELRSINPDHCVSFLFQPTDRPLPDLDALISADLKREDLDAGAALIAAASQHPQPPVQKADIQADMVQVFGTLKRRDPKLVQAIVKYDSFSDQPDFLCGSVIMFYQEVFALPTPQRTGEVLRFLAASL